MSFAISDNFFCYVFNNEFILMSLFFSVMSIASMSDYGGSVNRLSVVGIEGIPEKRQTSLNLYLLSSVSPMLMLIRSAWSNWLLVRFGSDDSIYHQSYIVT